MTIISYGALLTESSKRNKGERLTPGIYERLNTKTELMNDFTIDLFTFKEYQE